MTEMSNEQIKIAIHGTSSIGFQIKIKIDVGVLMEIIIFIMSIDKKKSLRLSQKQMGRQAD